MKNLLTTAGITCRLDNDSKWDHGVFIPLMLAYPEANIPVVSISLHSSLDPKLHYKIGEVLKPLRDQGVLIIASGMSFHNMREFKSDPLNGQLKGSKFDEDLQKACLSENHRKRKELLTNWETFHEARYAHPTEEHFIPLMVAAGAAGEDKGAIAHSGQILGMC